MSKMISRHEMTAAAVTTIGNKSRRRTARRKVETRTRRFFDPVAQWETSSEDVVLCTHDQRESLLASRPEASSWEWFRFPTHWVGITPQRPADHWLGTLDENAKALRNRLDQLKGRPPRYA
jgi:hypothetical protein